MDKTEIVAPLASFQTSYNKGSQPANLEGNSAHVIGGWFQHSPKGNAFKDPYVCLAPNQVPLNTTVFSYTTNLLTIHFIWELICLIAILLMFILVYCNENSIFQTMNKCIPVVLQWLNQSTGSTSRREFIQYVRFSVLLMPNIVTGFHGEDGTYFHHQESWAKSPHGPWGELLRPAGQQAISGLTACWVQKWLQKNQIFRAGGVEHDTRLSLLVTLQKSWRQAFNRCFNWMLNP